MNILDFTDNGAVGDKGPEEEKGAKEQIPLHVESMKHSTRLPGLNATVYFQNSFDDAHKSCWQNVVVPNNISTGLLSG